MKNKKLIAAFLSFIICLMMIPAYVKASTAGIYTATVTPSYSHPVTEEVEDSGNNAGIGQPMTESVLAGSALVEIDSKGNTYVTLRINMTDQLESVSFASQATSSGSWKNASATVMQKNSTDYTCDYRFTIPSQSAIIKITTYVTPMGRDVIFYATIGSLKSGSSDFVTTLTESDMKESASSSSGSTGSSTSSSASESSSSNNSGTTSSQSNKSDSSATSSNESTTSDESNSSSISIVESSDSQDNETSSEEETATVTEQDDDEKTTENVTEEEETSSGLEIYTKTDDTTESEETEEATSSATSTTNYNLILIILCVIAGFDLLLSIVFILVYLIRKRNQKRRNKEELC